MYATNSNCILVFVPWGGPASFGGSTVPLSLWVWCHHGAGKVWPSPLSLLAGAWTETGFLTWDRRTETVIFLCNSLHPCICSRADLPGVHLLHDTVPCSQFMMIRLVLEGSVSHGANIRQYPSGIGSQQKVLSSVLFYSLWTTICSQRAIVK